MLITRSQKGMISLYLTALVENISDKKELKAEHGLSLYIETEKHKLLFDTGASAAFAENADKMHIPLDAVDLMVLSHGHYDHGGGLGTFLRVNDTAKVYLHNKAFGEFYSNRPNGEKKYIGLDKTLIPNCRFVFTEGHIELDRELELFSGVTGMRLRPSGNTDLLVKIDDVYKRDDFVHEQNLIIHEKGKTVLIAGCAHNGIVNILEHFRREEGCFPDAVVGGFHLYNQAFKTSEAPETVTEIGEYLKGTGAKYYTCHCTGIKSYKMLKDLMGEQIDYLSSGSQIIL